MANFHDIGAKPKPTQAAKIDATTKAVRDILNKETAEREAKTARLRAAREALEPAVEEPKAPKAVKVTRKRK